MTIASAGTVHAPVDQEIRRAFGDTLLALSYPIRATKWRLLNNFPEIVGRLKGMLERFMQALSCIDQCFIGDEMLERLPLASRVGKTMVGGIDLNKPRLRHVAGAVIALSASPDGFTASALADQVRAFGDQSPSAYGPRQAAYDLKKLRGKDVVQRIGSTRRYEVATK